ncbi:hypothetical protein JKF63_05748 [Porcisia hertigi]|uniref:Dynamin-type G domain-containing protein n=1 Tax=Porcisia hertigi TaxID=2761500 RepID=A0A836IJM8_9TRYP|nr:hypothetical protein JKF63_05748 [Porcisia hertigi]
MSKFGASAVEPLHGRESGGDVPGSMSALIKKLHPLYTERVRPLEEMYSFDIFRPNWFEETMQNERPFVTLFGPWSAGKTTFINYLLQSNYLWTGPQPTTAEFTVVMKGQEPGPIDGQALANSKALPFKGLLEFGESFISNLKGFQVPHPLLERVTLIDTPGVLESASGIHQRRYDYVKVCRWFAERSDLIFVFFDPSKLSAGAELRHLFQTSFKGVEGRLRLVLNKADTISTQELMRVYGSLFWNLSNFINTTEPPRVYVGSFWDRPYNPSSFSLLFAEEKADLLRELLEVIPQQAKDKKIASLLRRAKEVLVHAAIIGGIRSELPAIFGKDKAKKKAREQLSIRYESIGARFKMNHRDFPPVQAYQAFMERFDVEKFPSLKKAEKAGLIRGIQELIDTILPSMLRPVRSTSAANPFDAHERQNLLNMYRDQVRLQFDGHPGVQDSSDILAPTVRQVVSASARPKSSWTPAAAPTSNSTSQLDSSPASTAPAVLPSTSPSPAVAAASTYSHVPLPPSQSPDMQAMMAMMQGIMAHPPQKHNERPDQQQSSYPLMMSTSVRAAPSSAAPPPEVNFAESSITSTPKVADSDDDLFPPTEIPSTNLPLNSAPGVSMWVNEDVSKPMK